jgi:hypothetical protein
MSDKTRLGSLLSRLIDGEVAHEELSELNRLLASEPTAKSELVDQLLLDTLLAESLGQEPLTALVDLVGQSTAAVSTETEAADSVSARPVSARLRPRRWLSVSGWLAAAASLLFLTVFVFFASEQDAFASATQIVEAAIRTHAALIERIYVVEVQRGADSRDSGFLSRDVRIATQGDRFRVEVRGLRDWTWGRDERGAVWMTLGRRKAVIIAPDEIGPPLQFIGDLYSLQLETLLDNLLKNCRLEIAPGPADAKVIVATPRRSWLSRPLRRATIEVDRETKAIRKLVIEREFERVESTCTFTLVDSRSADESLYHPEGHLTEPNQVFGPETPAEKRRELLVDWFGPYSERWLLLGEQSGKGQ